MKEQNIIKVKAGFLVDFLTLILVISVAASLSFSICPPTFKDNLSKVLKLALSGDSSGIIESNIQVLPDEPEKSLPFLAGEKLTYSLKYKGIKIGQTVLTFHGEAELVGRKSYLITLRTDSFYLKDLEKIYADKETFLPFKVERQIKKFGGLTDVIIEDYNQEEYKVEIKKKGFVFTREVTINRPSVIHNAILLSYDYRRRGDFEKDEKARIYLPTRELDLTFKGKEPISTPLGEYLAYAFEANSSKFRFWLKDDEKKIPLRIEDPGVFGYSLVIESIEDEAKQTTDQSL